MASKKEFGEGILYKITNYVWWFLLGNIYFALTNILFIVVLIGGGSEGVSGFNLITALSLLPSGPAFAALLSVMGKLIREKDVDMTKDFFNSYRRNFLEALFYWSAFIIVMSIIYIDILYMNTNSGLAPVKYILLVAAVILVSMMFYILPIVSRFYFRVKDVLKISFYYTLKKLPVTLLNWICFIGLSYMSTKISIPLFLFFFWSVLCYLVMFNERSILIEIEEKFIKNKEKDK